MGLLTQLRVTLDTLAKSILAPAEDPRQAVGAAYERHLDLLQQIRLAQTQVSQAKRRGYYGDCSGGVAVVTEMNAFDWERLQIRGRVSPGCPLGHLELP